MLAERWRPTHRLLLARFSADLKQLQNRNFWTSNRSKPIGVLTRPKCSCSDDHLPIGYLIRNFQPNRSNFLIRFASLLPGRKGGRHIGGGSRPPQAPPGGIVPITLWLILLTSFKIKLNHFTPIDVGRKWIFFLPTSFLENMSRNSQIDIVIWSIRFFFGWFGKTLWSLEKSCRRPSKKILTKILR